jgi:hypothetical protein
MFKKVLLSSVLMTGVLGVATFPSAALAQSETVETTSINNKQTSATESDFNYGPINFNFSKTHIIDQLLDVKEGKNIIIELASNKPFKHTVVLRNISTNELEHIVILGSLYHEGSETDYHGMTSFGPLKAGIYQVILGNMTETEQQGKIWMWSY